MKILALAGLLALVVVGCAESEVKTTADPPADTVTVVVTETDTAEPADTGEDDADTTTAEQPAEPKNAKIGDSITLAGYEPELQVEVTLVRLIDPAPAEEFLGPSDGMRLVAVRLRLRNVGTAVYDDSPSNGAVVIDRKDQQYTSNVFPAEGCPDLGSPTIRPDDRRAGCITFEVPKGARLRTFQFTLESGFGPDTGEWTLR